MIQWKKYMDADEEWTKPVVFIPKETEVPDVSQAPRATPGFFDIDRLQGLIAKWDAIFAAQWTAEITHEWQAEVDWLRKLYGDSCPTCKELSIKLKGITKRLKARDMQSCERQNLNKERRDCKAEVELHYEQHQQKDNHTATLHSFPWPKSKGMIAACVLRLPLTCF